MSSLVLAKFMTILLVLAHASMLLNSVSKSVSESSGTKICVKMSQKRALQCQHELANGFSAVKKSKKTHK